jgi:hypothetical protein
MGDRASIRVPWQWFPHMSIYCVYGMIYSIYLVYVKAIGSVYPIFVNLFTASENHGGKDGESREGSHPEERLHQDPGMPPYTDPAAGTMAAG